MWKIRFENSSVANKFSNFIARVTYPALRLGEIAANDEENEDGEDMNEEKKNASTMCMRIVAELIKPSVQQLTLLRHCPIEVMDVIQACATVTQIQLLLDGNPSLDFTPAAVQQKLQAIATRNCELARFVANPRAYPGDELLALMHQFDNCPTGRYMLACCFPEIPFFLRIKCADSTTAGPKKRKIR